MICCKGCGKKKFQKEEELNGMEKHMAQLKFLDSFRDNRDAHVFEPVEYVPKPYKYKGWSQARIFMAEMADKERENALLRKELQELRKDPSKKCSCG